MDILELTGGICGGVLVKDCAVYKKWIHEWIQKKNYSPQEAIKLTQHSKGCIAGSSFKVVYDVLLFNG